MLSGIESLMVLIFFIAPGFIIVSIINRKINPPESSEIKLILISLIFSIFNHLIISYWTIQIFNFYINHVLFTEHLKYFITWSLISIFALPIIIGILISLLLDFKFMNKIFGFFNLSKENRISSAWDFIFLKSMGSWVIIHLKSGDKVYAKMGIKSFYSLTHNNHDIFLEEIYNYNKKDGSFGEKMNGTEGAWVSSGEIEWISFWNGGDKNGKKNNS